MQEIREIGLICSFVACCWAAGGVPGTLAGIAIVCLAVIYYEERR